MKNVRYKKLREKGTIRIGDVMFIVTGDEYAQYYAELERKKYARKLERGKRVSYEKALEDGLPIERLAANPPISVEDEVEKNILIESMLIAIGRLNESDKTLIQLLFFNGVSMREISRRSKIPLTTLYDTREHILKKLKKLMGF